MELTSLNEDYANRYFERGACLCLAVEYATYFIFKYHESGSFTSLPCTTMTILPVIIWRSFRLIIGTSIFVKLIIEIIFANALEYSN